MNALLSTGAITALACVACLSASSARADFTPVRDSGSEATVQEIFDHYFTVTATGADTGVMGAAHESYTFADGSTATRINDFGAGHASPIDLLTGTSNDLDSIWTDGVSVFTAEARFAGFSQSFGIDTTPGDGVDHSALFSVSGNGYTDTGLGGAGGPMHLTGEWSWTRGGSGHGPWSSNPADNPDGLDHMITYQIDDSSAQTVWWLFFEDLNSLGDKDYNDLVVEVRAVPIPVPGAVALGVAGFSGFALLRRRLR
ncbi:MAG: DUF4114 domain-containing protein [Phycisphaerae bacterium]